MPLFDRSRVSVASLFTLLAVSIFSTNFSSSAGAAAGVAPKSVIVTTDCGADIDDQWTIVHLALSPAVNLLGVVGNFTPYIHGADTAACATTMLKLIGKESSVKVFAGADVPLVDRTTPSINDGVKFIISASRSFSSSHRLIVLGIGTGTDIASALLLDPTLQDRIEVISLAFNTYPGGGDGWNVTNDVKAWQVILDANVPVTTCNGYLASDALTLTRTQSAAMMAPVGPEGVYLANLHINWLIANGANFPETEGGVHWPIWDEVSTAVILGMTRQNTLPRPSLNDDQSFAFPNTKSQAPFKWVTSIDSVPLFADLTAQLRLLHPAPVAGN